MTIRVLSFKCVWFLLFILFFLNCVPPEPLELDKAKQRSVELFTGHRRLLGVLNFENRTELPDAKVGEAVSDKVITQLARTNQFILLERAKIEKILEEQALGQSGLISEATQAQAGQLLGVQGLVTGVVTEFVEQFESGKIGQKKEKWSFQLNATIARVAIRYKLVDVITGRVVFSDRVFKQKIQPSFGLKTRDFDFNNLSELDQTLVGKALQSVVEQMVQKISRRVSKLTWYGKVLKVTEEWIYFTPGLDASIKRGEVFEVQSREAAEVGSENLSAGLIQVTGFLQDKVSRAKLLAGSEISSGDWVLEYDGPVPGKLDSHEIGVQD